MHRTCKKRKLECFINNECAEPPRKRMKTLSKGGGVRRKKKTIKKMRIKQFKVQPKLSSSYEKDTVDKLMNAISDIHNKRGGECSFEELYRSCQSLCTLNRGKLIYDKLYILCDSHIECMINGINTDSGLLLMKLCEIWNNHGSEMHAIRQVFLMLDRTYVRQETECKSLWKMGINLLKKHILNTDSNKYIIELVVHNLLKLIESERNGEEIDHQLIKTIIIMIAHLNIYKSSFERQLIESTNLYYLNFANKLISELTIPDYLSVVMKCLDDEHQRCISYLDNKTQRYLSIAIEEEMINKHIDHILNKGFYTMCDNVLINDLRHLYGLFKSVNKLNPLKKYFYQFSKERGTQIVIHQNNENKDNDREMIAKLLSFKKKLDTIISLCFQRNGDFRMIIRKSWEYFINQRQNKPAELMAKFIDYQLQTGARGTSEEELEDTLDGVMNIFRFVNGKDVFQAFYKKDLAKRLLLNSSSSEDAEKNMINRIRKECGQSFASNLENMFKDIDISLDLNEKFKMNELCDINNNNIDFNVQVLTSGCWPTYNTDLINLPLSVDKYLCQYNKFYIRINSGRKLLWTQSLSHCILAANFPKGRKELVLSAFQAIVLLLFNKTNKLSFIDIYNKSGKINKFELKKTMLSLVKANILLKKTKGMECRDNEEFKLNGKYENRLRRIKVNQIQIVETKKELIKTSNKIFKDRQYQIDACIVRIMKARKELIHQQLMAQCLKQLKFDAQPKQIKKRIEALIENEYLERDKNNNNLYHYKA